MIVGLNGKPIHESSTAHDVNLEVFFSIYK